jgi:hypothetical protein
MAKSQLVSRCFYGVLVGILIMEALESVFAHDARRMLRGVAVVVLVWGVGMVLNFVIFPPLFRLLGRVRGNRRVPVSSSTHDNTA